MSLSEDEIIQKAQAVLARLQQMFGPEVHFFIGRDGMVYNDGRESRYRYGIFMDPPKGFSPPGQNSHAVVFLEEKPDDCSVQEFANYAATRFQDYMKGERIYSHPKPPEGQRAYETTPEEILMHTVLRAVDRKRHAERLKSFLHFDFLDMSGEYLLVMEDNGIEMSLPNSMLEALAVSEERLLEIARWNTLRRYGIVLDSRSEKDRASWVNGEWKGTPFAQAKIDRTYFYTVTNRKQFYGASLLLIPEALESLGVKCGMDYFVIPGGESVFMILRDDGTLERNVLKERLEILFKLTARVSPEHALTKSIYRYCRETKTLSII